MNVSSDIKSMQLTSEQIQAFNEETARHQRRNFAWNEHANWQRIREESRHGPISLESLPRGFEVPAVITGSGPTLDDCMDKLKSFEGAIFCGASQAYALDANGIVPGFVVAVDQHQITAEYIRGLEWNRTILVTHPGIDPSVLDAWTGLKRYWLLPTAEEYEKDRVALAYPWLRSRFSSRGCTPNAAYQIAVRLGYSPIYTAGVDFAFTGWKYRSTMYHRIGFGRYEEIPSPIVEDDNELPRDENGQPTTHEMQVYRHFLKKLEQEMEVSITPL